MKISIITPCFNAEKTLEDAYRSITSQEGVEFEILVADDGSADGTAEIIRAIAAEDPRVIPLISGSNAGVSKARNRALEAATGDFVFFLDADDKLKPDCLATLKSFVVDDTIDFVRGKHELWSTVTGVTRPNPDEERNFVEMHAITPESYPQIVAAYSSWNALFRRSVIEAANLRFNEAIRLGEDRDFNVRFFEVARRITLLNAYTYLWRKDEGNTQQATKRLVSGSVDAFRNALDFTYLAKRPWFVDNPRHALYLRSAMVVEIMNNLARFARDLIDDAFNPEARKAISDAFAAIPAGGVNIHIPIIKGWTEGYLPLYEYAEHHLGSPLKDEFFSQLLAGIQLSYPLLSEMQLGPAPRIGLDARAQSALNIVREAFRAAASRRRGKGQRHEIDVLRTQGLFDRAFYSSSYPDVVKAGKDEVEHFVFHGAAELRNPNGWFNTGQYLEQHPELLVTGVNPLVHYAMMTQLVLAGRN